ncbi:hypothetical protein H4Q26_004906 [Puccinia striiformis f. sp. tritici PST-130]|nr:hypothetical protein H4Q26_004906 [Puccinia striiformis f. sp. tritici PST-130]
MSSGQSPYSSRSTIIDRFGIPENQPIGLQYVDSDGDAITILELVLIDPITPFQPKQFSVHNTDQNVLNAGSTSAAGSTSKLDLTPVGGLTTQVIDPSGEFRPLGHATTVSCNPIKSDSAPCTSAADPPEYPIAARRLPTSNTPVILVLVFPPCSPLSMRSLPSSRAPLEVTPRWWYKLPIN